MTGAGAQKMFRLGTGTSLAVLYALFAAMLALVVLPAPALALKPIVVEPDQERIEITTQGEFYDGRGDSLQVETAPAADGMTGRISVTAKTPGTNPNWIVFALSNPTDKPIERWLTAERYNVIGSGAVWPDLDARRIEAVTPSIGYIPERIKSDRADIFRITLEPGQTITYVAELSSDRVARVFLWKTLEYELKSRDRLLFNGIMLGLTGLLAIFLTAIFAANHKAIFPSAALVAWCVLAYLCVDFGFFHKLFQLRPEDNAVYRAASESAVAASLVIFLSVFLRIAFWHGLIRMLFTVWIIAQLTLVAVAVIDPRLASTFARTSFLIIGAVGGGFTLFLALRGQDRALSLIPTWILFLIWIFGAAMVLTGRLSGDIVVSALVAGLVLILVLIGFTVTQYAFRSLEPLYGTAPSELQLRALAVDGAGSAVWEWNARRDEIKVSPVIEASLGLGAGELSTKVDDFVKHLHPADRDRFRLILWTMQERTWAKIRTDFRMRHADNSYRWFELEAASVPNADARALRCVGLMRDVTDTKRAHERLLHDAVHDSLTGLPNRELMLDRLGVAVMRARAKEGPRPCILFIDIDKFKSVNVSFGLVVGDSLLLTVARRLQSHLGPQDTLARVGGDQFAILIAAEQGPQDIAALAERVRRSLRAPIKIAGQDIVLTGSLGIAVYDGGEAGHLDLYKEAEIAMYRAKRGGADRIEIFRPEMRADQDDRVALESDLRKALAKNQIRVLYQPIIYLPTEELAGFEALVRWEHPKRGLMNPVDFVPLAEESDLIVRLGSHVLLRAAHEAARWQRELPREEHPLFVSVNISSRQIFRQNLIQEIRHILGRNIVPKGSLRLEITESLVMENPEQATEILEWLRGAGAELALDDFGTGLFVARLPAALPLRHHQDRPGLGAVERRQHGRRPGHRALDRGAGPRARQEDRRRGRGDAGGRGLPALHWLPVCARLLLRRADVGSRRAAAVEDGAHGRVQAAPARLLPRQDEGQAQGSEGKAAGQAADASTARPAGQRRGPAAAIRRRQSAQRHRASARAPRPTAAGRYAAGADPISSPISRRPSSAACRCRRGLFRQGFRRPAWGRIPGRRHPGAAGAAAASAARRCAAAPARRRRRAAMSPPNMSPPPMPPQGMPPPPDAAVTRPSAANEPQEPNGAPPAERPPRAPAPAQNGAAAQESSIDSELAEALRGTEPVQQRPRSAPRAKRPRTAPPTPAATATRASTPAAKRPAASKKPVLPQRPVPDFSGLPPAMAQSLARLAGVPWPPEGGGADAGEDGRQLEDEGAPSGKSGR